VSVRVRVCALVRDACVYCTLKH